MVTGCSCDLTVATVTGTTAGAGVALSVVARRLHAAALRATTKTRAADAVSPGELSQTWSRAEDDGEHRAGRAESERCMSSMTSLEE
jgi:hypothetical protein